MSGTLLLAIFQVIVWFAEYLEGAAAIPSAEFERIKSDSREIFNVGRNAIESNDPAYRICPTFEHLIN